MAEGYIFWERDLRVSGTSQRVAAERKLNALLFESTLTFQERLAGTLEDHTLNVWRSVPFGQAGDVVEFRGTVRPDGDGSVIEGVVRYKLRTKVQFLGFLGIGAILAVLGAVRSFRQVEPGPELAIIGLVIVVGTLLWIFASKQMTRTQITYISEKLAEAVNARVDEEGNH